MPVAGPVSTSARAQQRPRPKSRRHAIKYDMRDEKVAPLNKGRDRSLGDTSCKLRRQLPNMLRSTKAETEVSATPRALPTPSLPDQSAQQRPRPKSRRHSRHAIATCFPTTTLNKGRDRSLGDTLQRMEDASVEIRALNKGRDRSLGDTGLQVRQRIRKTQRSTKAETEVSATHEYSSSP